MEHHCDGELSMEREELMQMIMCDLKSSLCSSHRELEKQIESLDRKLDEVTRLLSALLQSKQQEEQQVH
ncbi:hypothetical protein Chor_005304 [Crotalus horridus]